MFVLADAAYDYITENGAKKFDYAIFSELMKQFFIHDEPNHPASLGLWKNQQNNTKIKLRMEESLPSF